MSSALARLTVSEFALLALPTALLFSCTALGFFSIPLISQSLRFNPGGHFKLYQAWPLQTVPARAL
ncbi:MAG: hypothetical protein WBE30_05165 [Candidatus Cybelea sp.]